MHLFLLTLLATAAYLENRNFGQFFLLRPILALPLIGLWLGDFESGLLLALPAELLFIEERPLGTSLPPEPAPAMLAALGGSLLALPPDATLNSWQQLLTLFIGLLAAWGFAILTRWLLQISEKQDHRFDTACLAGDRRGFERLFRQVFLRGVLFSWLAVVIVAAAAYLMQKLQASPALIEWSGSMLIVVIGITIATAIRTFYRRRLRLQTYLGILLGSLIVVAIIMTRGDLL